MSENKDLEFFDLDFDFEGTTSGNPTESVEETPEIPTNDDDAFVVEGLELPEEHDEPTGESTEEDESLKVNFEYLKTLGALYLPDDYEFKPTEEGFKKAVNDSVENFQKSVITDMFEDLPEEGKALLSYYLNGGTDVSKFVSTYSAPSLDSLDIEENEEHQELVVRERLKKTTAFTDKKIDSLIDTYKSTLRLKEEAEEGIEELKRLDNEAKASLATEAAREKVEKDKAIKEAATTMVDLIKSTKDINGIPFVETDAAVVVNSLFKPIKLSDGSKTTSFNYKLGLALQDPKKTAILAKIVENDFDFNFLARKKKTEATISLKDKLKETQRFQGGSGASRRGNFDMATADLDI